MANRKRYLTLATLVLGATAIAVFAGVVRAGAGSSTSPLRVSGSCASAPLPPQDSEVNTVLDVEHGVLQYSFLDVSSGEDRTVTIEYEDPACAAVPQLRELIAHVLANEARVRADTCAAVREVVESGAVEVRGRPIDRRAAVRLLVTEC